METRTITQVKAYILHLNYMYGRYEDTKPVAIAYSKEDLENWYKSNKVEKYKDDRFTKSFQKGSTLEWFNPIEYSDYGGIEETWTTIEAIDNHISNNRDICTLVPESNINQ